MELDVSRLRKRAKTASDRKVVKQLSKVVSWAEARGLTVNISSTQSYQLGRDINVKNAKSLRTILFSLLHECGHFLIGDTNKRFRKGYNVYNISAVRNLSTHRVAVLDEEFEAWERGWRLGTRLGLKICRDAYERVRANHIVTYCKFVTRRDVKLAAYEVS